MKHANQTYGFVTNPSQTYSNNVKNRRRGDDAGRDLEDGKWSRGEDSLAPREVWASASHQGAPTRT